MKTARCTVICLPLFLASGCASVSDDWAPPSASRAWAPAVAPNGEIIPGRPAAPSATPLLPVNRGLAQAIDPPALDAAKAYTLPELIDIAQSNNPETRSSWATALQAAQAIGITRSAYLPQVAASIVGAHTRSASTTTAYGIGVGNRNGVSGALASVALTWLLFDFGQRDALMEAAQQGAIAANVSFNGTHQRVVFEVAQAYYRHAASTNRAASSNQSLANARLVEAAATEKHKRGVGTVVEVAQARQATAQARLSSVQARNAEQNAYQALLAAIGVSPLTRLRVAELRVKPLPAGLPRMTDQMVLEAVASRPDVLAAYAGERAAAAQIQAAQAAYKPKVFGAATGSYSENQLGLTGIPPIGPQPPMVNLSGERSGLVALLGVSIPLYDGNLRGSMLEQARATAEKARANLDKVRLEAARQVVVAQNEAETGLAASEAATALVEAAQISFDAAFDGYKHGVGTVSAVSAAETALLAAKNAASDAYSAALSALVNLTFVTGRLGALPE